MCLDSDGFEAGAVDGLLEVVSSLERIITNVAHDSNACPEVRVIFLASLQKKADELVKFIIDLVCASKSQAYFSDMYKMLTNIEEGNKFVLSLVGSDFELNKQTRDQLTQDHSPADDFDWGGVFPA